MKKILLRIGSDESYEAIKNLVDKLNDVEIIREDKKDHENRFERNDEGLVNSVAEDEIIFWEQSKMQHIVSLADKPWMPGRPFTQEELEERLQKSRDQIAAGNVYSLDEVKDSVKKLFKKHGHDLQP